MSKLMICEKPSVVSSVGKVLGAVKRCDGYLESGRYFVSLVCRPSGGAGLMSSSRPMSM